MDAASGGPSERRNPLRALGGARPTPLDTEMHLRRAVDGAVEAVQREELAQGGRAKVQHMRQLGKWHVHILHLVQRYTIHFSLD